MSRAAYAKRLEASRRCDEKEVEETHIERGGKKIKKEKASESTRVSVSRSNVQQSRRVTRFAFAFSSFSILRLSELLTH